eukprot:TRINITY_DN151_c5_g1_i1.p1 TRINITY_DN151_c5_g1~~TRINITY_DN151_c5_g1_i1.p1  ORF type:complete len:2596 (-),score=646.01 TRINITY_DN151_c5_g1_i1:943-7860(-)
MMNLLICIHDVKLALSEQIGAPLEPFFLTASFYDSMGKCKLFEDYHFDLNDHKGMAKRNEFMGCVIPISKSIAQKFGSVWLILRMECLANGNIEGSREPYLKGDTSSSSELSKCIKTIKETSELAINLKKQEDALLKQFFCAGAIEIIEEGIPQLGKKMGIPFLKSVVKDRTGIYDLISEAREAKKKQTIPGSWKVSVISLSPEISQGIMFVDPMLRESPSLNESRSYEQAISVAKSDFAVLTKRPSKPIVPSLALNAISTSPSLLTERSQSIVSTSAMAAPLSARGTRKERALSSCVEDEVPQLFQAEKRSSEASLLVTASFAAISNQRSTSQNTNFVRQLQFIYEEPSLMLDGFLNTLFIYPEAINFGPKEKKAINISMSVYFRDDDDKPLFDEKGKPISKPLFYSQETSSDLTSACFSFFQCKGKTSGFIDEFKLKLPTILTPNHHLLFVFKSVNMPGEKEQKETKEWFAYLPLAPRGVLANGISTLPLSAGSVPRRYTKIFGKNPQGTEINDESSCFTVKFVPKTTIHPTDECIARLYSSTFSLLMDFDMINTVLLLLPNLPSSTLYGNFPSIMRHLFWILCSVEEKQHRIKTMHSIFLLCSRACEYSSSPEIFLSQIASYFFNLQFLPSGVKNQEKDAWEVIPLALIEFLTEEIKNDKSTNRYFPFIPFIFELFIKDFSIHLRKENKLGGNSRSSWIDNEKYMNLRSDLTSLTMELSKSVISAVESRCFIGVNQTNIAFARFICDLASIFHRGLAISMISSYATFLGQEGKTPSDKNILTFLEFDFLTTVSEFDLFIPLNIPIPTPMDELTDDYCTILCNRHPIIGLSIKETMRLLKNTDISDEVKKTSQFMLTNLLHRIEIDARFQSNQAKEIIAEMFFPMIILMISNFQELKLLSASDQQQYLVCMLFVLKHCNRALLEKWISQGVLLHRTIFLDFLSSSIKAFEWKLEKNADFSVWESYFSAYKSLSEIFAQPSLVRRSESTLSASKSTSAQGGFGGIKSFILGNQTQNQSSATLNNTITTTSFSPTPMNAEQTSTPRLRAKSTLINNKMDIQHSQHMKVLCEEASLTCLSALESFISATSTSTSTNTSLLNIFNVFQAFLGTNQTYRVYSRLFGDMKQQFFINKTFIFGSETPGTGISEIFFRLVKLSSSKDQIICSSAIAFIYFSAKLNFSQHGDISRLSFYIAEAFSKMTLEKTKPIERFLGALVQYSTKDTSQFFEKKDNEQNNDSDNKNGPISLPEVDEMSELLMRSERWCNSKQAFVDNIVKNAPNFLKISAFALNSFLMTLNEANGWLTNISQKETEDEEGKKKIEKITASFKKLKSSTESASKLIKKLEKKNEVTQELLDSYNKNLESCFDYVEKVIKNELSDTLSTDIFSRDVSAIKFRKNEVKTELAKFQLQISSTASALQQQLASSDKGSRSCVSPPDLQASLKSLSPTLPYEFPKHWISENTLLRMQDHLELLFDLKSNAVSSEKESSEMERSREKQIRELSENLERIAKERVTSLNSIENINTNLLSSMFEECNSIEAKLAALHFSQSEALPSEARKWKWLKQQLMSCGELLERITFSREQEQLQKIKNEKLSKLEKEEISFVGDVSHIHRSLTSIIEKLSNTFSKNASESVGEMEKLLEESEGKLLDLQNFRDTLVDREEKLLRSLGRPIFSEIGATSLLGSFGLAQQSLKSKKNAAEQEKSLRNVRESIRKDLGTALTEMKDILQQKNPISEVIAERLSDLNRLSVRVNEYNVSQPYQYSNGVTLEDIEEKLTQIQHKSQDEKITSLKLRAVSKDRGLHATKKIFIQCVETMSSHLVKLVRDTSKLNKVMSSGNHSEARALYVEIAQSYTNNPEISINLIEKLADSHLNDGNFTEAGVCKIFITIVICNVLRRTSQSVKSIDLEKFVKKVAPQFSKFLAEDSFANTNPDRSIFSEDCLISHATQAAEYFSKAFLPEFTFEAYNLIASILKELRRPKELAACYLKLHESTKSIMDIEFSRRLFGYYYRVRFFGNYGDSELTSCEWIYKEPPTHNLFSFKSTLEKQYSSYSPIFLDSTYKQEQLEKSKHYVLITTVNAHVEYKGVANRPSFFERNNGICQFFSETPFVVPLGGLKPGEPQKVRSDDIREQWKRKVIYTTPEHFPTWVARQKVIKTEIVEMSPIEVSTELIRKRTEEMDDERERVLLVGHGPASNLNNLQRILQGSVRLQVNGGVIEICDAFFKKDANITHNASHVESLRMALDDFFYTCKKCAEVNSQLADSDQKEIENGVSELQSTASVLLSDYDRQHSNGTISEGFSKILQS